jgi:hypothetical protein
MPTSSQLHRGNQRKPLTKSELTHWFAKFESADDDLKRFGMHHTHQILSHLNSPLGRAMHALMLEDISDRHHHNKLMQLIKLKQRIRRYILLRFLLEQLKLKETHNQKLNIEIQRQIDTVIERERHELESSLEHIREEARQSKLSTYEALEQSFEKRLSEMQDETLSLEARLLQLMEYNELMDHQYQFYATLLDDFDFDAPDLEQYLQIQFDAFDRDIESSYAKILPLFMHTEQHANPSLDTPTPYALHLNMRREVLKSVQIAHKQHRCLYNIDGIQVRSFNEAHFYVPLEKKLILDNGQYYLLNQNDNFQQLSTQQKQAAHKEFNAAKNDIMSIQMRLSDQRNQHYVTQQNRKDDLVSKIQAMKREITVVRNLLAETQQTRLMLQPTPSPTPRPIVANRPQLSRTDAQQVTQKQPDFKAVNSRQMKEILRSPTDTYTSNDTLTPFKTTPRPKPY